MLHRLHLSKGLVIIITLLFIDLLLLGYIVSSKLKQQIPIAKNIQISDRLIISRAADPIDHLPAMKKLITSQTEITKLYSELKSLPKLPETVLHIDGKTMSFPMSCPIDYFVSYTLDFYQNNVNILHAVYDPSGCRTVVFGSNNIRTAFSGNFPADLQRVLGLSDKNFYGYQNEKQD